MMIGREIQRILPAQARTHSKSAAYLQDRGLRWENRLGRHRLDIGKGEIVGLGGLDGQGQKELLLALFGVLRGSSGEIVASTAGSYPGLTG